VDPAAVVMVGWTGRRRCGPGGGGGSRGGDGGRGGGGVDSTMSKKARENLAA
jgi:hypothetical protein